MSGVPLRGRTILAVFGRSRSPWPVFALSGLKQLYVKNRRFAAVANRDRERRKWVDKRA